MLPRHLLEKFFDDFENKKKQTHNEKLMAVRKVFDGYNLISALHSYMSTKIVTLRIYYHL